MKKLIIILISTIITSAFAQDYKELIKNVPNSDKYPEASAINVFTKIDINVSADGTSKKHVFYIKKILTYKGKNRYSDVKLDYNANIETVELGECFSVRDGKKIDIPKEAIHDNGTYLTMYSPEYINQRQKVVNFPAIEPNDFIVVNYTITQKPNSFFSGIEQMQEENPYLKKVFSIAFDKNMQINYSSSKDISLNKSEKANKTVYTWTVENIPAIKDEKNKPNLSIIGKPIFYSAKANWADAANVYFKQFNSVDYNIKDVAFLVKDYKDSKMSNEQKLQKIYAFIQDNFEFKYALLEDGLTPQEPKKVLNQKFGSSKELTALFIAMAKAANIEIKPVLVIYNTDIPQYKNTACSDAITTVYAYYNGTLIGLHSQYMPFGTTWFEKAYLIFNDNTGKLIDYKIDTKSTISRNINIKLNKDFTANADFTKTLKGKEDFKLRRSFKNETEKKRKIWFTSDISDKSINVIGEPAFKNLDNYNKNLEISFKAKINNFYKTQDNYIYLKLPNPEEIDIQLTGKNRENPYEIHDTYNITEKYVFENIPQGYTIIKPKAGIINTYKDDKIEMSFEISSIITKDGKIIITRNIVIPKTIISKENYPKFAKFISEIQTPLNNMVFLAK